jgi:peptidoglycan hydrolase-like protein with peptidoglycan-binding domain
MPPSPLRHTNPTRLTSVLIIPVLAAALSGAMLVSGAGGAAAAPPPQVAAAAPPVQMAAAPLRAAAQTAGGYPRFYRPGIKRGARDGGPSAIKHVRELQYRLRWAKTYRGKTTGYFGSQTEAGVKAFQRKHGLPATGRVDARTWRVLIQKTLKRTSAVPTVCKKSGWRACYDRKSHQLFLFGSGSLWNVWLVRGGSRSYATRTGTHAVYARYLKKRSSLYGTWMYYFQKFDGGIGLHGSPIMTNPFFGHSHGCVNMYIPDSKVLWSMTHRNRLVVTVYGPWS